MKVSQVNLKIRFDTLLKYLIPSSLIYLSVPYLIFATGWLKWYAAVFCTGLILLPLYLCIQKSDLAGREVQGQPDEILFSGRFILLTVLFSVVYLGFSGIGGVGFQDADWYKHNAILKDLIQHSWPVMYQQEGQLLPLVYYLAYYLPAALFGKWGGWNLANQVLFIWSYLGLILAILWFLVSTRLFTFPIVFLFLMFSGLDLIGELITRSVIVPMRPEILPLLRWNHIENWSVNWQYSSHATLLFWVPHHALAGWIVTGILMYSINYSHLRGFVLFILSLTTLWSPFVTIGLLPYVLTGFFLEEKPLLERLKQYITLPNFCGLSILALVGIFYGSKLIASPLSGGIIPNGFSLSFPPDTEAKAISVFMLFLFYLLEFGIYSIIVFWSIDKADKKVRGVFFTTLACLLLIPLYRFGEANDFVMRTSIPALYVLAIYLGRTFFSQALTSFKRFVLIITIVLGSTTSVIEILRHVNHIYTAGTLVQVPPSSQVESIEDWEVDSSIGASIMLQYVGSSEAPFFELLARDQ